MSRIVRFAVLVASLMSLFAVMSSTAGAVTWDNSGNTHFTATAGAGTLSSTAVALTCLGGDATGKTTTPAVGVTAALVHATINFTSCSLSGQAVGVECGVTLTASSQSGSVTSGVADATCGVYLANVKVCHIEGTVNGTYTNPSGTTPGTLQTTTGGSLRTTNGVSNCPLGPNDPAHLSVLTFRVTNGVGGSGTLGPIITRTA